MLYDNGFYMITASVRYNELVYFVDMLLFDVEFALGKIVFDF